MILEFDAGNTLLKWRLLRADGQRFAGGRLAAEELKVLHLEQPVSRVRAASVADPAVDQVLVAWVRERYGLAVEFASTQAAWGGVVNSYRDPSRMGVDRWLAMLAAFGRTQGACCVVDCGSAITVDFLSDTGRHQGGYIMPGLRLLRRGLLGNTSRIQVEAPSQGFPVVPGRSTAEAVNHGINLMFAAVVERLLSDLQARPQLPQLWVTGGDGELFTQLAGCGQLVPELVMDGLACAVP